MSQREKDIMRNGETNQGEGLQGLKMKKELSKNMAKERSYSKGSSSSKGSPPGSPVAALLFRSDDYFDIITLPIHSVQVTANQIPQHLAWYIPL